MTKRYMTVRSLLLFYLLLFVLLSGLAVLPVCDAQQQARFSGTVVDEQGSAVSHAEIADTKGAILGVTADNGTFSFQNESRGAITAKVSALAFDTVTVTVAPGAPAHIVLQRQQQSVVVSAYRSPLDTLDSPASTRIVNQQQLREAATPALDGKLRQVPGLELFRRSSSLVANPTSMGISLRGLGSTAASRTLVVSDDVPLNDPYGGWIHWEEMPALAVRSVEVVRGGASDLYGSAAIGGVIDVIPVRPKSNAYMLDLAGASRLTSSVNALFTGDLGHSQALAATTLFRTAGSTFLSRRDCVGRWTFRRMCTRRAAASSWGTSLEATLGSFCAAIF